MQIPIANGIGSRESSRSVGSKVRQLLHACRTIRDFSFPQMLEFVTLFLARPRHRSHNLLEDPRTTFQRQTHPSGPLCTHAHAHLYPSKPLRGESSLGSGHRRHQVQGTAVATCAAMDWDVCSRSEADSSSAGAAKDRGHRDATLS